MGLQPLPLFMFAGDIMGCGILFPRDYSAEALDSDGSRDSPGVSDDDDNPDYLEAENYHGSASSDSEDEHWWERPHAHSGTTVQVSDNNQIRS